ncbi:glycosyltransferase family 4 protein [Chromohalobacter israelensis]
MKVVFCVRHNFFSAPGGAQIQILNTKKFLEKEGVECDLVTSADSVVFSEYDIIHLSDLTWTYDILAYVDKIKRSKFKGKVVLSTIYWPFDDYAKNGTPLLQSMLYSIFGINGFERIKALAKLIKRRERIYLNGVLTSYINAQRDIVNFVDLLLPNSEMEIQALFSRLEVRKNYHVVNNAIDVETFKKIKAQYNEGKEEDLILFVARIDARKNQLAFLKSMMNTDYRIRFIGNPGPNSKGYYQKLKKLAKIRGNVEFFSHLSQEEVFANMLMAKVNVLTSWIETPGLVSLEASYARCNVVVSDKGSVREYFKEYGYYCDPSDVASIKEAVLDAVNADFNSEIIELIEQRYTWPYAARQTLQAYKKLVD